MTAVAARIENRLYGPVRDEPIMNYTTVEYTSTPPSADIPIVWCDFNAWGLSGDPGDNCYYSLHREQIKAFSSGDTVFIYDDDESEVGVPEVFGCVARLESVVFRGNAHLRARPESAVWYRGPRFWHSPVGD